MRICPMSAHLMLMTVFRPCDAPITYAGSDSMQVMLIRMNAFDIHNFPAHRITLRNEDAV